MRVEELRTDQHISDIRNLAKTYHDEFGIDREFDITGVTASCLNVRKQDKDDVDRSLMNMWIVYDGDTPVGFMVGTIARCMYSWRKRASQNYWFVVKESRGSSAAKRMVKAFEHWATKHKCEQITMSVEHMYDNEMVKRTIGYINALGYNTRGAFAIKHIG
jgi:hypothetical protein